MNNKGQITVFLCLILTSILLLGTTIINVVNVHSARGKAVMCATSAMSDIRAEYNNYIFEHYHILLFDVSQDGKGQGNLEEKVTETMEYNLGERFSLADCAITNYVTLYEDEYKKLKEQISEYLVYVGIETAGEYIISATGGDDGTLPESLKENLENAEDVPLEDISPEDVIADKEASDSGEEEDFDPRDFTSDIGDMGVLYFVMPDDMYVSNMMIDLMNMPSFELSHFVDSVFEMNEDFDDYSDFKTDLTSHESWCDEVKNMGAGISYATLVFNSITNPDKNPDTVLDCEMEYLICGKGSDRENLEGVVNKIVALRLPINFAYLVSDSGKMSEIKAISFSLSLISLVPEPVMRYLLAGCWAYVESLAEVRSLLEGKTIPFNKTGTDWITDFKNLEGSMNDSAREDKKGLNYEHYLCILMALNEDKIYPRMLDLMQLNSIEAGEDICVVDAGVEVSMDISVIFEGRKMSFSVTTGY